MDQHQAKDAPPDPAKAAEPAQDALPQTYPEHRDALIARLKAKFPGLTDEELEAFGA